MIKIMIVDDDKLARIGITNLINWKQYNMEIVFETPKGYEALEYLKTNPIDLALIDLEMPSMNGLELLKNIKIISPHTECVMITMHDNFKYIQEALRIGVMDYIIKTDFCGDELLEIIQRLEKRLKNENKSNTETHNCIIQAMDIIKNESSTYFTASEIANRVHMSRSYFSTCFKQITGNTFNEYVRSEKMKLAQELLKTDTSILEVARSIGFSNEKYFSTLFKNQMGISPSEYRKQYSN